MLCKYSGAYEAQNYAERDNKKIITIWQLRFSMLYYTQQTAWEWGNGVSPTWCDHQVHVKAISCRFKSCYLHQRDSYPNCPFSHVKISENARKWLEYWGFDNSHHQVGFLSVSVKQDKMLSLLQPFAVRFAVEMSGFINKYKRINPQTAVKLIPTVGKWRIIYRQTIVSIQKSGQGWFDQHCPLFWTM